MKYKYIYTLKPIIAALVFLTLSTILSAQNNISDVWYRDALYDDPSNYSIAYIMSDEVTDESLASITGLLGQVIEPQIVYTTDELDENVEAVIIDNAAYENIDKEWIETAARHGLIIALIDMHFEQWADLVNSECSLEQTRNSNPFENSQSSYYYINLTLVQADNPEEQLIAEQATFEECRRINEIEYYVTARASHGTFSTERDVISFTNSLMAHINSARIARYNFANRHLEATSVPNLPFLIPTTTGN